LADKSHGKQASKRDQELAKEVREAAERIRNKPGRPERIIKSSLSKEIKMGQLLYGSIFIPNAR
jgi:hypothetical protein